MLMLFEHTSLLLHGFVTSLLWFLIGGNSSRLPLFTIWLRYSTSLRSATLVAKILTTIPVALSIWYRSEGNQYKQDAPSSSFKSGPLRPLIFPCKTTHTRLFPKSHSFGYNYLQVGIPIGWQGSNSILGFDNSRQRPWFSVRADDYLARVQEESHLDHKLAAYLTSQGENPKDYAHVYLVTAPRFLGYAFNPVSFWYLFSNDLRLQAMILEVNNTFDERRIYFMKQDTDIDIRAPGEETKFTYSWPKDFHVSPFNSRKGDYSLAAINPFTSTNDLDPKINNVITLKSSKGHPKIIARIFSTNSAIDPTHLNIQDTVRLISSWFWTGFLTFPRILKEAAKLFFQHKLHVWYRPEVVKTSIGRQPSKREHLIASLFQSFLQEQVHQSSTPVVLDCVLPNGSTSDTLHLTSQCIDKLSAPQKLMLQILTPQFYTDIVTGFPAEYISNSAQQKLELQTFTTTSHRDLVQLFTDSNHLVEKSNTSITVYIRAYILSALRWDFKHTHELDGWVIHSKSLTNEEKNAYLRCATTLIIATRLLGGFDIILDWALLAMQMTLAWKSTGLILDSIRAILQQVWKNR